MSKDRPWGKGTPTWTRDATTNDSSKDFVVPAGKMWNLKMILAQITATATVGNRVLQMWVFNTVPEAVYKSESSASITASTTGALRLYREAAAADTTVRPRIDGAADPTSETNDILPDMLIPAGYSVRIADSAAIDAAADDLIVVLHYVEYDA